MSKESLMDFTNLGDLPEFGDPNNKLKLGNAKISVLKSGPESATYEVKVEIKYISNLYKIARHTSFILARCLEPGLQNKWLALAYNKRDQFRNVLLPRTGTQDICDLIEDVLDNDKVRGKRQFTNLTECDLNEMLVGLLTPSELDMYFNGRNCIAHKLNNDQVIALFEHFRYSTLDKSGKDYLCYSEMTDKEKKIMSKDMYDSIIKKLKES